MLWDAFAADSKPGAETQTPAEAVPYDLSAEKMMTDNLLILGMLFFIFYFILIRPQQQRLKQHKEMMKLLAKGNRVITSGGLIGVISKFEGDEVVVLEIAANTKVRVTRQSIAEIKDNSVGISETANDN
jgi:preprotein translocase subunit YajC